MGAEQHHRQPPLKRGTFEAAFPITPIFPQRGNALLIMLYMVFITAKCSYGLCRPCFLSCGT